MAFNALMKPAENQTRAQVEAIGTAGNGVAGFFYMTSDLNAAGQQVYGVGQSDGSIAFLGYEGDAPLQDVGTTPTVAMVVDANGVVTSNVQFGAAADNIASDAGDGVFVPSLKIHADSQSLLEYDQATNALRMTSLADKTKIVDTTSVDLAAAIAAHYATGTELQVGDVIYLNNATGGGQIWVNTVGKDDTPAGDASDFILWSGPDLTDDYIRNLLSGGNGIDYNPTTGVISALANPIATNDVLIDGDGIFLDVSAAPVLDTHNRLGGGAVDVDLQALLDNISGQPSYTFDMEGDTGGATIEIDTTVAVKGGSLLKNTLTDSGTGTVTNLLEFDTTGATAGQVPTFNGTEMVFEDIQTPLSFQNGLTNTNGTVEAGGALLHDTLFTGDFDMIFQHDIVVEGSSTIVTDPVVFSFTNFNEFFSTIDITTNTNYTNSVGDVVTFQYLEIVNNGNVQNTIRTATISNVIAPNQYTLNLTGGSADYPEPPNEQLQIVSGLVQGLDSDIMYRKGDYTNMGAGTIVYLEDPASGALGYAPYALPTTAGTTGQILKVDATGNLAYAEDASNLTANNGLGLDNDVIQLGGNLIQDTTISTNGSDLILEGGTQTTSTMTDTSLITRHVNSSNSGGVKQIFAGGRYSIQSINPANDALNFGIQFDSNGATFVDTRATKKGFTYTAPNMAHWTNDTLITKAYADALVTQAENGVFFDTAAGKLKLGGNLTQNTSINLDGNEFTWAGNAGDSVRSTIDMEFLNAAAGTIYVAPEDGSKWRVGVSSPVSGVAHFSLTQVV